MQACGSHHGDPKVKAEINSMITEVGLIESLKIIAEEQSKNLPIQVDEITRITNIEGYWKLSKLITKLSRPQHNGKSLQGRTVIQLSIIT